MYQTPSKKTYRKIKVRFLSESYKTKRTKVVSALYCYICLPLERYTLLTPMLGTFQKAFFSKWQLPQFVLAAVAA